MIQCAYTFPLIAEKAEETTTPEDNGRALFRSNDFQKKVTCDIFNVFRNNIS